MARSKVQITGYENTLMTIKLPSPGKKATVPVLLNRSKLHEKTILLNNVKNIVDLGCAPGGCCC
jgi:hypothetical protein